MSVFDWLTLAGLCLLGAASPGPSVAVIVAQALRGGRLQGVVAALAHGAGVGCYALLAALGLAALVANVPVVFTGLRWAGAVFLLWLAFMAYRSALAGVGVFDPQSKAAAGFGKAIATGFLTAFLNPKLALFFLAVYSQFVSALTPLSQKLGMAAVSAGVDALWYLVVALMVTHPRVIRGLRRQQRNLQLGFAVLLVVVALQVLAN